MLLTIWKDKCENIHCILTDSVPHIIKKTLIIMIDKNKKNCLYQFINPLNILEL